MFGKKFKRISAIILTAATLMSTGLVNVSAESTKLDEHLFNSWTDAYYRQYVNPDDSTDVWHTLSGSPFQFRDGNDLIWSSTISNMEKHSTMKYRVLLNKYIESRAICIGYNTAYVKPETEVNDNTPFIAYIPTLDTIKTATVAEGQSAINKMIIESKINCGINACKVSFNFNTTKKDAEGNSVAGSAYNDLIQFKRDGKIYVGGTQKGTWEKNKTYTLSLVESIGGKTVDVYMDGKLLSAGIKILSDESTLTGFSKIWWYADYTGDTETAMPTGLMYVDDFKVYSGDMPTAVSGLKSVQVDETSNTITVPGILNVGEIKKALAESIGSAYVLNTSEIEKADSDLPESTDTIKVTDGTFTRNYAVEAVNEGISVTSTKCTVDNTETENEFTNGLVKFKYNVTSFENDVTAIAALAQYDSTGKLMQVDTDTAALTTDSALECELTVTQDAGTTMKAMLWNAVTLAPITTASIIKYRIPTNYSYQERYPDWNTKAFTISIDDGSANDAKMIEIFKDAGIKATFNLNSNLLNTTEKQQAAVALYDGFEVANHTKGHPDMRDTSKTDEYCISAISEGRKELSEIFGRDIEGLAWPCDAPDRPVLTSYLAGSGKVAYARTAGHTYNFNVPSDFSKFDMTTHVWGLTQYGNNFLALPESDDLKLFSVWGHAYEFGTPEEVNADSTDKIKYYWSAMEDFAAKIKGRTDIWKVTSLDLVNYINALRGLKYNPNDIVNNSDIDVYLTVNSANVKIPAHSTFNAFPERNATKEIAATDSALKYTGRWTSENGYETSQWGAAYVDTTFTGTTFEIKVKPQAVENMPIVYTIIDGKERYFKPADYYDNSLYYDKDKGVLNLTPYPLADTTHTVKFAAESMKENQLLLSGVLVDSDATITAPAEDKKLIEFIGDSITTSAGNASTNTTWSAENTFAWKTGELLKADHTQISALGIALTQPRKPWTFSMREHYFDTKAWDQRDITVRPRWDCTKYTPDEIVINIGQNDTFPDADHTKSTDEEFTAAYVGFLGDIRAKYPDTEIFVMRTFTGVYADATMAAVTTLNTNGDTKVHYVDTTGWIASADCVDGVHPKVEAHQSAAEKLAPILGEYLK